jgi:hypothetical protein
MGGCYRGELVGGNDGRAICALKIVTLKPYIYRFFTRPPGPGDWESLQEIIDIFGREDFRVPIGEAYALEDFAVAIRPGRGKNYFVFPGSAPR